MDNPEQGDGFREGPNNTLNGTNLHVMNCITTAPLFPEHFEYLQRLHDLNDMTVISQNRNLWELVESLTGNRFFLKIHQAL